MKVVGSVVQSKVIRFPVQYGLIINVSDDGLSGIASMGGAYRPYQVKTGLMITCTPKLGETWCFQQIGRVYYPYARWMNTPADSLTDYHKDGGDCHITADYIQLSDTYGSLFQTGQYAGMINSDRLFYWR